MAETQTVNREYVIPLREALRKVPSYKRTAKGVRTIKEFIAKHMKVADRDVDRVKLDVYFNNDLWSQGCRRMIPKVKVKAHKKSDGTVMVSFVEDPAYVKFLKVRHHKHHVAAPKAAPKKEEVSHTAQPTTETKASEGEKEQAVAEHAQKEIKQDLKAEKHTTKKKEPEIHRQVLKK